MKEECDSIIQNWQMTFQVSDFKENHFFNLLDDKYLLVKPTYIKGGSWLKLISHSNLLCTRAIRTITNHTFIGEYYLRFFLRENFDCSCKTYPIESRYYIFHRYRRYNNYWNLDRESLSYFIIFLKYNSGAFFLHKGIT